MGASNSKSVSVIKNGDWEHHICWLETPDETPTKQEFKRQNTLTNSLNDRYHSVLLKSKNWKKLRLQDQNVVKNTFEMESVASTPKTSRTTYTEEFII